ncbi:MAG: CPBP family intramembrane metalloprotease [Desulfobacteraceae bacterium]|nr:MAG: CPBP family intramembrane metalloprotease [Desulfobacteraceae bacterium]
MQEIRKTKWLIDGKENAADPSICSTKRSMVVLAVFPIIAMALLNAIYVEDLYRSSVVWFWIVDGIQFLLVPGAAVFFLVKAGSIFPRDYGFKPFGPDLSVFQIIGLCLLMCVVFWLAYFTVINTAYHYFWPFANHFGYSLLVPEPFLPKIGVVLYLSGTAALVEEAVFRGLPWYYFSLIRPNQRPILVYVLLTSILFSAIHSEQGPHGMIASFFLGIAAAILYAKIKNLWPFIVGHFILDVISFW